MDLTDLVRGKLTAQDQMTLGALITIDVHARDVVTNLAEAGVSKHTDFEWVSQASGRRDKETIVFLRAFRTPPWKFLENFHESHETYDRLVFVCSLFVFFAEYLGHLSK